MNTWKEKRQIILRRDNFTCQLCRQFNPELGRVEFLSSSTGEMEFHEYFNHPNPFEAEYIISQSLTGYTFEINFGNCWPVFPIMQVHHKKYIDRRERWDYDDEDLITYCKTCHTNLHLTKSIPIYSTNNIFIEEKLFLPVDEGCGRRHQCPDWTFIQLIGGGEYLISDVKPTIRMILFDHEDPKDAEAKANTTLERLINNCFPRYARR